MKFSPYAFGNLVAWGVLAALALLALVIADRLGFVGLLVLGALTWLICSMARMDQDAPTWGMEVFRARMRDGGSPEQRAAGSAEREAFLSPLRFYARCGMVLAAVGAAGFCWQLWYP